MTPIPVVPGQRSRCRPARCQTAPGRRRAAHRRGRGRGGFTLMEAALVTMIVGVGIVATLELVAAGTMANASASKLTTGVFLAGHVREMLIDVAFKENAATSTWGPEAGETTEAAYDDLDDFDGRTFNPPLSGRRVPLGSGYANWSQAIEVHSMDEDQVNAAAGKDNAVRPLARVLVRVSYRGELVYETSWLVANAKRP